MSDLDFNLLDPPAPPVPPPPPAPEYPDIVLKLLDAHNSARKDHGRDPLVLNKNLYQAAQGHADYMAKMKEMAHFGIGDGSPWDRISKTGYTYSSAGENVAWNQQSVEEVMTAWMWSLGHRMNILGGYKEAGFAVTDWYWCTDFATPSATGIFFSAATIYMPRAAAFDAPYGKLVLPAAYGH